MQPLVAMTRSSLLRLILIQILILSSFLPFLAACAPAPASDLENSTDSQGLTPATAPTRPLAPSPTREPAFIPSPTSPTTPLLVLPDKPGAAGGTWTEAEARELTRQAEALWADVHAIAGAHPPADVAQVQPVVTERDGQWLVVGLRLSGQDAAQVYGEGAVLTIGIDPETREKGMLTLSLDGARLALDKQAGLNDAQMAELDLVGPEFIDSRWLVFDKEGLPRVVVNEKNQWQALKVLEMANTPLAYFVSTDTLYLWSRDGQQFDTLTFPAEITDVTAKGESLKVTLADGTEKTLTQDKETGEWKEKKVRSFIRATELSINNEADRKLIEEAVANYFAGGVFWDENERIDKFQSLGFEAHQYDDVTILVTPEAAKAIQDQGVDFNSSLWAQIIKVSYSQWSNLAKKQYENDTQPQTIATFDNEGNPVVYVVLYHNDNNNVLVQGFSLLEDAQITKPYMSLYREFNLRKREDGKQVVTDEYEVGTHVWNEEKGEWVELKEYEVYTTPEKQAAYTLYYKVFKEKRMVDGKEHTNVFGLDKEKVQAVIDALKAGKNIEEINANEAKAAGIYILTDADGEPQMVVIRGGEYGLSESHFNALVKALDSIKEADPNFFKEASEQSGAKFISATASFKSFSEQDTNTGSNDGTDTIFINPFIRDNAVLYKFIIVVERFEVEASRKYKNISNITDIYFEVGDDKKQLSIEEAVYYLRKKYPMYWSEVKIKSNGSGKASLNFGSYAAVQSALWADVHRDKFKRQDEFDYFIFASADVYKDYTK